MMDECEDQRPPKQRKKYGRPFLPEVVSDIDDDGSSTTSSSGSESEKAVRRVTRMPTRSRTAAGVNPAPDTDEVATESDSDTDTSSSDSSSSDGDGETGDDISEDDTSTSPRLFPDDDEVAHHEIPTLTARLMEFLPQLERANAELQKDDSGSHRLDVGHEDDEQYIEMDLSLGVLEQRPVEDVEMPLTLAGAELQESDDLVRHELPSQSASTAQGKSHHQTRKRKIEELAT
jgi:hypothetical protein